MCTYAGILGRAEAGGLCSKELSNSASAVLQTNASLLNLQHRIVAPRARCLSPTAAKAVPGSEEPQTGPTVDPQAHVEAGARQTAALSVPQAIQWLATGCVRPHSLIAVLACLFNLFLLHALCYNLTAGKACLNAAHAPRAASWYHCTPCIAHTFGGAAADLRGAQWPAGAEHGPKQCKAQMAHEGHAHRKQLPWGVQVVLAQVAQSARSAGLEQRLAALEHARVPGSAQGSPCGGRMTHGAAESGCEAVGAEDLSSILSRLVLLSLTCCTGTGLPHLAGPATGMLPLPLRCCQGVETNQHVCTGHGKCCKAS